MPRKLFCCDRKRQDELLVARIAARELQLAGGFLLDVGAQHDPVGPRPFGLLDLQILLEIAERLDPVLRALDLDRVERVAFVDPELAADDLVAGDGVAVDVDPLDIDARRVADADA